MTTTIIIIAIIVLFAIAVRFLTKISDHERRMNKLLDDYKKECDRTKRDAEQERIATPAQAAQAALDYSRKLEAVAKAKEEEIRKAKEAAATKAAQESQTQMAFEFEAPIKEHKTSDPNKPKRKSPVAHSVIHHDDNFWLELCREYQVLKHKNPKLTRTDFVKIKNDPTIKAKTFDEKMRQLTTTGMFIHKPRKTKK